MSDQRIDKALKSLDSEDCPQSALGKAEANKKCNRSRFWPNLLTAVLASGISLACAIPLTIHLAQRSSTSSAATLPVHDVVTSILASKGSHYYDKPVETLLVDETIYGEFYYCFNDEKTSTILVHLDLEKCQRFEATLSDGKGSKYNTETSYVSFTYSGWKMTLSVEITAKDSSVHSIDSLTLNMEPFYHYVMSLSN